MSYTYPPINATNPEQTQPVPAMSYEFWAITRVSNVVTNITDEDPGGGIQLMPHGTMTIRGRKYESVDGVINPMGDETSYTSNDLFALFNEYPELGDAYNAFIIGFAPILELIDNQNELLQMVAATFEQKLHNLRAAALALRALALETKIEECIANFPGTWDMRQCLEHLGLIETPTP